MSDTAQILIVTGDPKLREELLAAIASLGDRAVLPVVVDSLRKGIDAARNRAPDLILVEMTADLEGLRNFAREVADDAPVAAVFRPETFDADVSESTIIIGAIRAGVKDFLRRPVSSAELGELLTRSRGQATPASAAAGRVISFISNKGGVGKSTLAVNSAVALAMKRPDRVLLIDASLQMGVAASMLDLNPRVTLTDAASEQSRMDETMLRQMVTPHASGLHLLAAPADAVEAAAVNDEVIARVITLARRTYDFVVVDTFPLFDRVVVAVLDVSDRAYVVVENVVPTVVGAAKMLQVLDSIGYPKAKRRVVLNRMTSITGGLSAGDVAARLDSEIHAVLPYDKGIIMAANMGQPYAMQPGGVFGYFHRFAREFHAMVRELDSLHPDKNRQPAIHGRPFESEVDSPGERRGDRDPSYPVEAANEP
ncbi:AAA family ATPase [Lignipirellula cremea]|uniref:Septum site-determining protein MinD n=1 Tax=Lignipirellula cremea TaxID=2528010 RepID=A0A518E435_9BACT|nr:AAA family ATPase [Lignipirellula cremea]QDU98841.1 Septum site-determining protein MinD [Lignipirellula cremea]